MTDSEIEAVCEDWDRYHEALGGGASPEEACHIAAAATSTTSLAREHAGLRWDRWTEAEREAWDEYMKGRD